MRDYVIVTDSASDLPKEILKEYDIPCLPLYYEKRCDAYNDGMQSGICNRDV